MTPEITTRPIYARHTGTDGNSFVQEHVVWSTAERDGADVFIADRNREATTANARAAADKKPALAGCEQITPEQYLKERAQ